MTDLVWYLSQSLLENSACLLASENAIEGPALRCRESDESACNIVVAFSFLRIGFRGHASETAAATTQAV